MNNIIIENIKTRRSVRKYKNERISKQELNTILEAGKYAPSALNQQSSLMVVVESDEIYNDIDKYIEYKSPCIEELYKMCGLK